MVEATRREFLEQIEAVEGREYKMYMLDNIPHIGIGHNIISRSLTDETMEFLGIEDESDLMTATLNDEQCEFLFFKDLDIAVNDARQSIGKEVFEGLSEERQEVLVDMSFNLGGPRFRKFKKMIGAVQIGDFHEASVQILDSEAARDKKTAKRYADLSERMKGTPEKLLKQVDADGSISDRIEQAATDLEDIARDLRKLI